MLSYAEMYKEEMQRLRRQGGKVGDDCDCGIEGYWHLKGVIPFGPGSGDTRSHDICARYWKLNRPSIRELVVWIRSSWLYVPSAAG